ncbi:MAG: T9SS type A sorting domain-containing protein, partial [Bacteroidales bacterium]|nr:T9SS type A sorting domain-containing protein [Bacteroidales bacterium]
KPADAENTYIFTGWSPSIESVTKAQTYTAQFSNTTNKYLIRFLNEDGTELQSGEVEYGQTPAYTGEAPEKPADAENTYVFTGWSPSIESVTEAKTYTAQFSSTTNKYLVMFLNEDGTELQSEELAYGATPVYTGETPEKPATAQYTYTFKGWDSEIVAVTGAKDYKATYTSTTNKYLITFENYNGEELQSGEVEYGVTPTYSGEAPEKPADAENTYVFIGWSPSIESVTKAQTYTAQFSSTTNLYTVRFLNEDGTKLQSEELAYGATPAYTGETPTKDATAQYTYTFKGWDSEITTVTGAKDYTATYTPTTNKYLITFENYDGEVLQSSDVEYGQIPSYEGTTPAKPADVESTYTFSGWSPNITAVTGAQTYTAVFTKVLNTYTVTAEVTGDGGTVSGGGIYSYGTEVTLTATPEHGYHVSKWSTGETSAEIKITVTEDMAFTVSFIHQTADNTPECANAPAVAKYDWLLMLNANAIKDKGYNLNENIVDWYRVVGEMDNLDSGERDDEKVGSGYYYTINSKLNDTGDYYALIDLPWQTTEVGCSGLMRTVVFHYAPKGTTKRAMAVSPTITYPEQQIEIVNLPKEEVEVYVYDVAGRLYRSFHTDGEPAAAFKAEPMAGTYIVVVWTSKGKETFKYIVRKR